MSPSSHDFPYQNPRQADDDGYNIDLKQHLLKEMTPPLPNEPYRQPGAKRALIVLSLINLLNFADRYVPSSVKEVIKADLDLTDTETALPNTGMVLVYMVAAVCFAALNDRTTFDRRKILAGAVCFWSLATAFAGFANSIGELVFYRSLVGVGEAAFGTIVPPFLSDFFPPSERNSVFGLFYLAIPIGGALGYAIGASVGSAFGWRVAFYVCGFPGLLIASATLSLKDPPRGINDVAIDAAIQTNQNSSSVSDSQSSTSSVFNEYCKIMSNAHYVVAVLGTAANLFALGGLADWYSSFAIRYENSSLVAAGLVIGVITIVAGIGGNLLGSVVSQYYEPRCKSAYFLIPSLFTIPGAIFLFIAININHSSWLSFLTLGLSEICLWTQLAPISTLMINVIESNLRGRAMALSILIQHILGDVISPPIIGGISDEMGLRAALQITWVAVIVSGLCWFFGYVYLSPLAVNKQNNGDNKSLYSQIFFLLISDEDEIKNGNSGSHTSNSNFDFKDDDECFNPMISDSEFDIFPSFSEHSHQNQADDDGEWKTIEFTKSLRENKSNVV